MQSSINDSSRAQTQQGETEIDIGGEELMEESMLDISRTYTLTE